MEKSKLLDRCGAVGEDRLLLAKVLDKAAQAQNRNAPVVTDFLSPQQQLQARELLAVAGVPETAYQLLGGYEGAERCVLFFLPDWMEEENAADQSPLRVLRAAFRKEEGLTHRDLLGSLMGMGIVREKVGDILVAEESADLVVMEGVADFLLQSWNSAGRAKLTVCAVSPEYIHIPVARCREIRDTVASLRLDTVVATGFQMSRGKAADLIAAGRVQLNWKECTKADRMVSQGDNVSARGFGKITLAEIGGLSRKGRTSIVIRRYL